MKLGNENLFADVLPYPKGTVSNILLSPASLTDSPAKPSKISSKNSAISVEASPVLHLPPETSTRSNATRLAPLSRVPSGIRDWIVRYTIPSLVSAIVIAALALTSPRNNHDTPTTNPHGRNRTATITLDLSADDSFSSASSSLASRNSHAENATASASDEKTPEYLDAAAQNALAELVPLTYDRDLFASVHADAYAPVTAGQSTANTGFGEMGFTDGEGRAWSGQFFSGLAYASSGRSGSGGAGVAAPSIAVTFMPSPPYPEVARREKREGTVELAVNIDANGRALTVAVANTSGHSDLDESARLTVQQQWRFRRSDSSGQNTATREYLVSVAFSLDRR